MTTAQKFLQCLKEQKHLEAIEVIKEDLYERARTIVEENELEIAKQYGLVEKSEEYDEEQDDEEEEESEEEDLSENLIDRFEKFVGKSVKPGRVNIKGFPVDLNDTDGSFLDIDAVDADAAKGLAKELKKAGFKVKTSGKTGLVVEGLI